jgi:hypothetical protein
MSETDSTLNDTIINDTEVAAPADPEVFVYERAPADTEVVALDTEVVALNTEVIVDESSTYIDNTVYPTTFNNSFITEDVDTTDVDTTSPLVPPFIDPLITIMQEYKKIALLICPLSNGYAKAELIANHGFCEENIVFIETGDCNRDNILRKLNTIIGSSNLLTDLWIYYSGYGNRIINSEVIDNLMKIIVPSVQDEAPIEQDELVPLLQQSMCNTICVMDMCPPDEMLLKWGVDTIGQLKIMTFSESTNTNKFSLIRQLISV